MPNKIYLIPNFIHEEAAETVPGYIASLIGHVRCFMVEDPKAARILLKEIAPQMPLAECAFFELSEHTSSDQVRKLFHEHQKEDIGIIAEAGCPCIADPGAEFVGLAHEHNLEVVPLAGPSSIVLALMASGLSGQNFAFNGYLPKEKEVRQKRIRDLEKRSGAETQTQIIMETPYHNQSIFDELVAICDSRTLLCIASDLTSPGEFIKTMPVADWRGTKITLGKRPTLFLIQKPKS